MLMASDFAEALGEMVWLVCGGLCIFFLWQTVAMVIFNRSEGEPTAREMVANYFKKKNNHLNKRPPSDQNTNKRGDSTAPVLDRTLDVV